METARRTGRRRGGVDTRTQILDAARIEFARKGFKGATMRSIADAAGVNVALPAHYFGGKKKLFAATLELPAEAREQLLAVTRQPEIDAGELTRTYLGLWEDPDTRGQLLAIVRSGLGGGEAIEWLRELLTEALDDAASSGPQQKIGLVLATSHLLGTAVARHLTQIAPLSLLPFDELVTIVTPAIEASLRIHLDG
ncbi:TetR/AcrR family transcriptional regulator [uncultured Microbacterium sp.]|uniref:TetR/AcrR family transcriptional regulator n=1 Tax=uncultured Microbacterium sp. TaxID=191216 RepID=UPI0025F6EBD3|nr:TetR family transcriptional regulator [uncultured Microbacterium sp.]